jgi:methionine-rich copper-binding protein CopC
VGQDGLYSFTAAAGANLTMVLSGGTIASYANVRVLKPDGSALTSNSAYPNTSYTLDFIVPTAGTYTISIDPNGTGTGQLSMRLVQDASGSAGTIDGAVTTVSLGAGQNGRYSFTGTTGDRLGLGVTSVSTAPASQYVRVTVLKPDGSTLYNCSSYNAPGNCNLPVLPTTGTYTVFLDPPGTTTATVGLLLSRTVEGSVAVDGAAVSFSTSRVGQDGRYSFTAAAGANLTMVLSGGTIASYANVRVLKPDGSALTSNSAYPNTSYTVNFTAPTAGTYSISIDPSGAGTGQLSIRVNTRAAAIAPTRAGVKR